MIKRICFLLLGACGFMLCGLGYLAATEYRPADRETISVEGNGTKQLSINDPFRIEIWNIGYAALGEQADFFMDGGKMVQTASREEVLRNLEEIKNNLNEDQADIVCIQEIDRQSSRTFKINEYDFIAQGRESASSFAYNFKTRFVPYPIPPIGEVGSGVATFSKYDLESSTRVQLPIPFRWPVRMVNLKRCLLVSRIQLSDSDRQLVVVNLHLEAYDDGEGKKAQTETLRNLLKEEAEKGNYVVAGGDFNQLFSSADASAYPVFEGKWQPGILNTGEFDDTWQFLMDETSPTCRSLDQPYQNADHKAFQYYLIDGFIVSDNLAVRSFETINRDFKASDHNPVIAELEFLK